MKLIFVNDHIFLKYNNEYYTSGTLTAEVMKRYIDVFGNITLVTRGRDASEIKGNLQPSSVDNTTFVRVPDFLSIRRIYRYFDAKRVIKNEVKKADYVIARTSTLATIAIKYARKYNKPYLVEVVGCAWDSYWNYSKTSKILAPYKFFKQKEIVKNASYVIYVTNEFLQRRYPTNGRSTNCSNVSLKLNDSSILERRIDKINCIKENEKIIIGTAAAVDVKYKGQQYIIEALGVLKKRGITNIEYQLAGRGDQSFLIAKAKKFNVLDQVKFLGPLPHEKIFNWLDTIDLYAQPSRQEGLPRAVIEAMSRGLPVIGANTAGIPELLQEEFIFSNGRRNIKEICDIILNMTKDKMIELAHRNFEESKKYDMSIIEQRRKKFLNDFLHLKE